MNYILTLEDTQRLETSFTYHRPLGDQPERYTLIRCAAEEFAELLMKNCPRSRELSLALTHLEEAVMEANASIARHEKE